MAIGSTDGAVTDRPAGIAWTAPAAALSIVAETPRGGDRTPPSQLVRPVLPRCPEIDCVRHLLPAPTLALAELRAAEVGVGADRVLIAQGLIEEEIYLTELARQLGVVFEPLDDKPREACPLSDERMLEAAAVGMLPLTVDGSIKVVVAPRELTVRSLFDALGRGSDLAHRIRITSNQRLSRFIADRARAAIGYQAAEALRVEHPELSAGTGRGRSVVIAALVAATALFALVAPGVTALAVEVVLGLIFLAWTALRLLGSLSLRSVRRSPKPVEDHRLPMYTVAVALYREAAAAPELVAALRRFNYPALGSKLT
jgi:hypothetical protein